MVGYIRTMVFLDFVQCLKVISAWFSLQFSETFASPCGAASSLRTLGIPVLPRGFQKFCAIPLSHQGEQVMFMGVRAVWLSWQSE